MRLLTGLALVLLAAPSCSGRTGKGRSPSAASCRPSVERALLPPAPGQRRVCVVDVGSRNVKLQVLSAVSDETVTADRSCKERLQLGEKTVDHATRQGRHLDAASLDRLGTLLLEYRLQCESDGGILLAAVATEWARRATNATGVLQEIKVRSGLDLQILSRSREGVLGQYAAAKGRPGFVALDFGSRSFQLSYWSRGGEPVGTGVALGIDEAAERFFDTPQTASFRIGREAFVRELRASLGETLEAVKAALAAGTLHRELVSIGENGDVALAAEGRLWSQDATPGRRRVVKEAEYGRLVADVHESTKEPYGRVMGLVDVAAVRRWADQIEADSALFESLRGADRRKPFGHKMMAFPALVLFLADELGLERVVLSADELAVGLALEALRARGLPEGKVP